MHAHSDHGSVPHHLSGEQTAKHRFQKTGQGFCKYFKAHQDDALITGLRNDSHPEVSGHLNSPSSTRAGLAQQPPSQTQGCGQVCVQGGLLCADCALLYSSFHLPAQVRVTSCRHRANSRDPRPLGEVPGVQVPAIPQHGKGANCLDRPQDNMPPLPSPLAPQEKILWPPSHPNGISLSHLGASSAWTHKLKHLAPFTFLFLHSFFTSPIFQPW